MRLLVRTQDSRFSGSAHALRSAYNHFTLVEPFPNGNLFFKRAVDRPVTVYVIADKLFVLATAMAMFSMTPIGGGRFHLENDGFFFSLGDFLDDDTCAPTDQWTEGRAWEAFRLIDAPPIDERERAMIERIDRVFGRRVNEPPISDEIAAEVHAYLASIASPPRIRDRSSPPTRYASGAEREIGWGFRGSVDIIRRTFAAGWAARGREPTSVSVFVNAIRVGEAHGSGERPDVMAAGFALCSAWSFEFPTPLLGPDDHVAFRFPDGSPLRMADAHEPCLSADMSEASHATSDETSTTSFDDIGFCGCVDFCGAQQATGWAARGQEATAVTVYLNGQPIGNALPSGERPDVADAGYARQSAWSFVFPRPLEPLDCVEFRCADGSLLPFPAGTHHSRGNNEP